MERKEALCSDRMNERMTWFLISHTSLSNQTPPQQHNSSKLTVRARTHPRVRVQWIGGSAISFLCRHLSHSPGIPCEDPSTQAGSGL